MRGPSRAVTPHKQRRVAAMAVDYLSCRGAADRACRFDVVAIDDADTSPRVTVYPGAFDVG